MTDLTTFDRLKGAALVCTFLGFLATCAALVSWWDTTWRIAVEPTRASVYSALIGPSPCLRSSWIALASTATPLCSKFLGSSVMVIFPTNGQLRRA
jgi:hypothetical protein